MPRCDTTMLQLEGPPLQAPMFKLPLLLSVEADSKTGGGGGSNNGGGGDCDSTGDSDCEAD
jgi:hypothetical protein